MCSVSFSWTDVKKIYLLNKRNSEKWMENFHPLFISITLRTEHSSGWRLFLISFHYLMFLQYRIWMLLNHIFFSLHFKIGCDRFISLGDTSHPSIKFFYCFVKYLNFISDTGVLLCASRIYGKSNSTVIYRSW